MKYSKVFIDKPTLMKLLGIDENIDLAITRVDLNVDDSIDITFVTAEDINHIPNGEHAGLVRRYRLFPDHDSLRGKKCN